MTHYSPTSTPAPNAVIAKVKTAAQTFWALVVEALIAFGLHYLGVDVTELALEAGAAIVALTVPLVVAILMWIVDHLGNRWPIVKRLWIFVSDPIYVEPGVTSL